MASKQERVAIPGSFKRMLPGAEAVGEPAAEEFNVTLTLRRRQPLPALKHHQSHKLRDRIHMSHREQGLLYGAETQDLQKAEQFAEGSGLRVVNSDPDRRMIVLSGKAAAYHQAFGVELKNYIQDAIHYRGREGAIFIPASLEGIVTSLTGLDNRPFAKPHVRVRRPATRAAEAVSGGVPVSVADLPKISAGFSPAEIAALYDFPAELDGTGETIGILELGGGFSADEVQGYFGRLGMRSPKVSVVPYANGGTNQPGANAAFANSSDLEVMLDILVAGAAAPGANIVVYFAPDLSDQSFLSVMSAAIHDTVNKPSIISLSWGGAEDACTEQFKRAYDELLQSAASLGITVCVASGDNGSADQDAGAGDGNAHVDFPASSPFALSCGGTKIDVSGAPRSSIVAETVWHDGPNDGTGGGVSRFFPLPDYQQNAGVPAARNPAGKLGRGVPDVAANAAPSSGYQIVCGGHLFPDASKGVPPAGGTSAVAPLWAGLIARINQKLGKPVGFINSVLYRIPPDAAAFRDITEGNNGDYEAAAGWDACTGIGSPRGKNLLKALLEM